jgi:hypothetical protein
MLGKPQGTTARVLSATGVVVLALAGAATGMTAASGAPTATKVPALSHQLCYTATAKGFKIPRKVSLKNQFSPRGFQPRIGALTLHCNPVQKTVLTTKKVFPITYPVGHLACFSITESRQPTQVITLLNQFGTGTVVPGQPSLLCLPSWKSLSGPPRRKPVAPPGLDHFTCYPIIKSVSHFVAPPLLLKDEFTNPEVRAEVKPAPVLLCLPTQKTVAGRVFKIVHPGMYLLCFAVTHTPIKPFVFDQNQFGTARVAIGRTKLLCLPSTRRPAVR